MQSLADWLKRQAPGPKPKRPLKRTQKPRPMSPKRQRESRLYTEKRKAFLAAHPRCMAIDKIVEWYENAIRREPDESKWPKRIPFLIRHLSTEIHHMKKPKCKYLNDESTWLAVCRWSHEWIENNKATARQLRLLV